MKNLLLAMERRNQARFITMMTTIYEHAGFAPDVALQKANQDCNQINGQIKFPV